ncbi:hypothetical protein MBOT_04930 [Mycobacterium botniense]|uniref:Uncharacterized protein n=1 Tax=Mycobacterium botniense TaxID=84962 RepID=A0A7I9XTI8_9MYCO|nr:hypothetical protein MBOT_04930 [Mycobacterium botniense]
MGYRRIEQGASQLCAQSIVNLQAAVGKHLLCRRGQPQQPGRRAPEQRGAAAEHPDAPVDLHRKAVG